MRNSSVLFYVSMEISRRQFHSGKIGYTQKVASPWATAKGKMACATAPNMRAVRARTDKAN